MSTVVFHKLTGSGNDFVMLDGRTIRHEDWPAERIARICDRRMGIGADGLVILDLVGENRVRMSYFNSDGSPADMCGNAALCSTRLAAALEMADPAGMTLVTGAGEFMTRCVGPGDMAELNLPDTAVPQPVAIDLAGGERSMMLGTVGVPHLVAAVSDLAAVDVENRGRELRFHSASGPAGANVNFFSRISSDSSGDEFQISPTWSLRTYERGVEAETLSCGTGTVTTALAIAVSGLDQLPLSFRSTGGRTLSVSASISGGMATEIWLAGEGRVVARGIWLDR